jgi:hypothetical protein
MKCGASDQSDLLQIMSQQRSRKMEMWTSLQHPPAARARRYSLELPMFDGKEDSRASSTRRKRHVRGGAGADDEYQDQVMQYIVSSSRRGQKTEPDYGKLMTARGKGVRANTGCDAATYGS